MAAVGTRNQQGTQRLPFQVYPGGQWAPRPPQAAGVTGWVDLAAVPCGAAPAPTMASACHATNPTHDITLVMTRAIVNLRIVSSSLEAGFPLVRPARFTDRVAG
jgi:hypothetical protein